MSRALVLDANSRQGLVAIRSLGRHGVEVTAGSTKYLPAGALSRHSSHHVRYEDPRANPDAFIDSIETELGRRKYSMLLPLTEQTVIPVVEQKSRLERLAHVPFLSLDQLRPGLDKKRAMELAEEVGIGHPRTVDPKQQGLDEVPSELGFPVVVKPRRGSQRAGVSVCESFRELERVVRDTSSSHGPVIVQEFIPNGGEVGVYLLYDWSSTLKGVTVQRRLRSHPPEGGPSTLRETVDGPELIDAAERLLKPIGWAGVAMVEFRIDPRDGDPKLLEINPRLWGSLALSIHAGVDFPALLYDLVVQGDCSEALEYEVGVRSRWLFGDLLHVMARDDRLAAVREFLEPSPAPGRFDVLSATDPLPVLRYLCTGVSGIIR